MSTKRFTPIPPRDEKTARRYQLQDALYAIAETDGLDAAVPYALQRAFVDMAQPSAVHQKSLMTTVRAILVPGYGTPAEAPGRPAPPGKVLGMFESWVRVIGGILMVAEIRGFLDSIEDLYAEADLESGEQREFFPAWRAKFKVPVTIELAGLETGLPNIVLEAIDRKAKLGYYLREIKDKAVRLEKNGLTYIAVSRRNRNNLTEWFLKEGTV